MSILKNHIMQYNLVNHLGYYDQENRSVRRQFLKAPVKFSRISSRYSKKDSILFRKEINRTWEQIMQHQKTYTLLQMVLLLMQDLVNTMGTMLK